MFSRKMYINLSAIILILCAAISAFAGAPDIYPWSGESKAVPDFKFNGSSDDVFHLGSAVFPGDFYDILYHDGHIWIADGEQSYSGNLKVYSVFDPANPELVGAVSIPGSNAFRLDKLGDRICVSAEGRGILIYDGSNPQNPQFLGECAVSTTVNDIDQLGDVIFAYSATTGLAAVDISNPASPQLISSLQIPGNVYSLTVTDDSLLITANGSSGLKFYDVRDLSQMREIGEVTLQGNGFFDVVHNDRAVFALYRSSMINRGGFAAVDVSNPPNFSIISQSGIFGVVLFPNVGLETSGDTLYFAAGQTGMQIWDISNPSAPVRYGGYGGAIPFPPALARWSTRVTSGGGYAYSISPDRLSFPTRHEVYLFDISDITDPHPIGTIAPPSYINKSAGAGDYAYVAAGQDGIISVDISNPREPFIVGQTEFSSLYFKGMNLIVEDTTVYINGGEMALGIVSVANPESPAVISEFTTYINHYTDIDKEGNLAVVSGWGVSPSPPGWIEVIEVSNPAAPQELGFLNLGVHCKGLDIVDTLVYVAFQEGLGIVDLSDPYSPTLISQLSTGAGAHDVKVRDSIAYLIDQSNGLIIIDYGNPRSPHTISSTPLPDMPSEMALAGDTVYIADNSSLVVIDVSNLLNPVIRDVIPVDGYAYGVSQDEGRIFLCDYYGFHIYSHQYSNIGNTASAEIPRTECLLSGYPNPFNSEASLEFHIQQACDVRLVVYNLMGQEVAEVFKGRLPQGRHSKRFNAGGLSSGMYFYRLQGEGFDYFCKAILLK